MDETVVTLVPGDSRTLSVEETSADGEAYPPGEYSWTSSDPTIVQVSAGGVLTAGLQLGLAVVTVRSPSGRSDTIYVWVQPPPGTPSTFRITLEYLNDVPERWRAELARAAARWQEVIRRELPAAGFDTTAGYCPSLRDERLSGVERGVRIYVRMSDQFDTTPYPEAVGGPCLHRPLPEPTVIFGRIAINRDTPLDEIVPSRLRYLALHEMGHAPGLVGLVQGPQPTWLVPATGLYRGPLALEGYRRVFGMQVSALRTRGGHWEIGGDVMSHSRAGAYGASVRISAVSTGALMDLGYPAAWYGADE